MNLESSSEELAFFALVSKECSDYINYGAPLYRGFGTPPENMSAQIPRMDRGVDWEIKQSRNFLFNEAFHKKFGIDFIRNRSVFASTNIITAKEYGTSFLIFPTNKSTYIWGSLQDSIRLTGPMLNAFTSITRRKKLKTGTLSVGPKDQLPTDFVPNIGKLTFSEVISHLEEQPDSESRIPVFTEAYNAALEYYNDHPVAQDFMPRTETTKRANTEHMIVCKKYYVYQIFDEADGKRVMDSLSKTLTKYKKT